MTIRVGVVGGGWFGQFHVDNLLGMADVAVAGVATANEERLAALAAKAPGAHAYRDYRDLVDKEPDLDALVVCVPPDRHDGIELAAAKRGIHLFMEKPLGVDMETVLACEKAIVDSGIICAVGYQTRYNPALDDIKRQLADSGDEVGAVVAKWLGVMPETPWWRVKARSGGQFAEQVTHIVDVLRYLFGDVKSVFSTARTGLVRDVPQYDVEDASATTLVFESGLLASVVSGCFVDGREAESEIAIEIYAKRQTLRYRWDTLAERRTRREAATRYFGNEFHLPALRTFIEAVRDGDPRFIRSSYPDAVKTFRTTWAANESMRSGAVVAV